MTDVPIILGDTIRHLKRGSRYRILARISHLASLVEDGGRYWIADSTLAMAVGTFGIVGGPKLGTDMGDQLLARRPVIAQIDDATRKAARASDQPRIPFFIYDSLDYPGQCFMRPVSEFTADRFERLSEPGPLTWFVQSRLPEEQVQMILDHDAILKGAAVEGTELQAQAAAYLEEDQLPPGGERDLMDQIAAVARAEQGGDDRRMHISLSAQERAAVEELSAMQDLSPAAVIRQALRLYQAQVKGFEPGPPMGCMGD